MNLAAVPREFRDVPLGLIDEPALASRTTMDEGKLDELTNSIRANGLIQPLNLARLGERYEVIAGHRRLLACKRAGLVAAPSIVYPTKSAALDAVQYAENRHREDLNVADEAIWFAELLESKCGGDVDALCELLSEKRTYVEGRLLLFQGDPKVFEALQREQIKIGTAHKLNECTDQAMRRYYLDAAIRGGATIAVVAGWIQQWRLESGAMPPGTTPISAAAPSSPMPEMNYFLCAVCLGTDNVHLMQPVNVHQHCKLAILDPMLKAYHGEG